MATPSAVEFEAVSLINAGQQFSSVLVCEHASNHIPDMFEQLGISSEVATSHVAWDPGAFEVSRRLAELMNAPLVKGEVSRLVYDCNRPPQAADAIPEKSEVFEIPGNLDLDDIDRDLRVVRVYLPFRQCIADTIAQSEQLQALITIHSFTPVYNGEHREVEIGILHDTDARLADEMLQLAPSHTDLIVRRNEPYGPQHGVTHTLKEHALSNNLLNVMIEIRNDLIATSEQCQRIADMLHGLLLEALGKQEQAR